MGNEFCYYIYSCFSICWFFDALGKSPYSHSLKGILLNIIFVGSALVGREIIRSYLVNSLTKRENYLVFILVAFFMTITDFSIGQYINIKSFKSLVQFIAQYFAPELAQNLFSSYLVYIGGPIASIIYLGIIQRVSLAFSDTSRFKVDNYCTGRSTLSSFFYDVNAGNLSK